MTARSIDEPNRTSSNLELLFDLTFVVAVAAVTAQFSHHIADGRGLAGLVPFLQIFFAVWWAWMNFTWFASAYDTDDVAYRLLTMVQMGGVLVLAAGVPAAAEHPDYRAVGVGYLIMRVALVAQWLRVAVEDPPGRRAALRYAAGIGVAQAGWLVWLATAQAGGLAASPQLAFFVGLAALELAVPRWAERPASINWHPHHIAERYGLFTLILFGESVYAATNGVRGAFERAEAMGPLIVVAGGGLILLFALWWLYFLAPAGEGLSERRHLSFLWGYGHYGVFASLAALGAGLEAAVEQIGDHVRAAPVGVCYAVAIPAALCVVLLWTIYTPILGEPLFHPAVVVCGVIVVLILPPAASRTGAPAVVAAIATVCVLTAILAIVLSGRRSPQREGRTVLKTEDGIR
ncbi:low temperature requirement protein A [Actinomadura sp. WMMA1423]|uniref:low temperature requirement protein A n=1 Tax=Actinomadura sp. WMMA1423 TaxID=2591108 RepID=UPI0011478163|nr:low temperature requirement protein A [Actinomadura sp. WMMA1423]